MKKYFLFSSNYVKDRNTIESARGKEFVLGTVAVDGSKKEFSMISNTDKAFGYTDIRIVACLDTTKAKYTLPSTKKKTGI